MAGGRDRFGNPIDPVVGYARGRILKGAVEEQRKREKCDELIRARIAVGGVGSIHNFSGLNRGFPIGQADLEEGLLDAFLGYPRFQDELRTRALRHLGGTPGVQAVTFLSRVSAGIVLAMTTLADEGAVIVSVVPGGHSHPSFRHGAGLARARFEEIVASPRPERLRALLTREPRVSVVSLTAITMWWHLFPLAEFRELIDVAHQAGKVVFVDDASAGVRYVVGDQPPALELGADLVVCSGDKAGLFGPRCGFMGGRPDLVARIGARAMELGMEAQPQVRLGLLRSLERFDVDSIRADYEAQRELCDEGRRRYGRHVSTACWYLNIDAEDILDMALARGGGARATVTPSEAASALALVQLRDHGILTVAAFGAPGATLALRYKLSHHAATRFGGMTKILAALDDSLDVLARLLGDPVEVERLLLG